MPDGVDALHPAAAYNAKRQEYLVVWHTDSPGNDLILAQRLSRTGARLGSPMPIAVGSVRRSPDVVYNSAADEYLVVWVHNDGSWDHIRARRLTWSGVPLGTQEIQVTVALAQSRPAQPAVAYASVADRYLVVYSAEFLSLPGGFTIWGQLLTPAGALDGSAFAVSHGSYSGSVAEHRQAPDVAYNRARDEFLVAWQQKGTDQDVYARLLSGIGMPLPPQIIEIGIHLGNDTAPRVAAVPAPPGDGRYLVAWEWETLSGDHDVHALEVTGGGTARMPHLPANTETPEYLPCVVGSESAGEFLVSWTQRISGVLPFVSTRSRSWIAESQVLGPAKGTGGRYAANPEVVAGPNGDFLLVYDDPVDLPGSCREVYGRLWGNRVYPPVTLTH